MIQSEEVYFLERKRKKKTNVYLLQEKIKINRQKELEREP